MTSAVLVSYLHVIVRMTSAVLVSCLHVVVQSHRAHAERDSRVCHVS